jgi:hypothetical protein
MDVGRCTLYKELGAAYNDSYWYRPHNGITTRAQAVQIWDYYNKTELPPYGDRDESADTQGHLAGPVETHEEWQTCAHELNAPQLSIIEIDQDMEDGTDALDPQEMVQTPTAIHRSTATIVIEEEEEWQHDAITMTEEDYILKHCVKAATPTSGVTMDRYLGLRTRKVLGISLLLAVADVQLQKKWKGMRCRDLTVMTQPHGQQGQCSATSLRSRAVL